MKELMKQYDTNHFTEDLKAWGMALTERQLAQFLRYYEMLAEWNKRMNLTAITEYEDVIKKHFVDSLSLAEVFGTKGTQSYKEFRSMSLIDVGTGAGFPVLP